MPADPQQLTQFADALELRTKLREMLEKHGHVAVVSALNEAQLDINRKGWIEAAERRHQFEKRERAK
jgi:hypothetical protein